MLKKQERKAFLQKIFVILKGSECEKAKKAKELVKEMLTHDGLFIFEDKE